jgi:hypothetical protein
LIPSALHWFQNHLQQWIIVPNEWWKHAPFLISMLSKKEKMQNGYQYSMIEIKLQDCNIRDFQSNKYTAKQVAVDKVLVMLPSVPFNANVSTEPY